MRGSNSRIMFSDHMEISRSVDCESWREEMSRTGAVALDLLDGDTIVRASNSCILPMYTRALWGRDRNSLRGICRVSDPTDSVYRQEMS
jgi:hypothetical protein